MLVGQFQRIWIPLTQIVTRGGTEYQNLQVPQENEPEKAAFRRDVLAESIDFAPGIQQNSVHHVERRNNDIMQIVDIL